jgi:aspartyl-tRNA(Asn)/glutamyl-tRNA(Gln) amidotransferase subunit B
MEKGSMRLEPNISVRITGTTELPPYKVEVKNINSFRFGKLAIEYEVKRHIELLEKGEIPPQETRGFNDKKNITVSQRRKEEASDYRYFPDPDIPPFEFTDEFIKEIADRIPELPHQKVKRYVDQFEVKNADAYIITRSKTAAYYFDELLQELEKNNSKQLAAKCAAYIVNKKISLDINPKAFIEEVQKLQQPKETDAGRLSEVINEVISQNPELVDQYKAGKTNLMNALLGMVMKEMKGQADPQLIRTELEKAM